MPGGVLRKTDECVFWKERCCKAINPLQLYTGFGFMPRAVFVRTQFREIKKECLRIYLITTMHFGALWERSEISCS